MIISFAFEVKNHVEVMEGWPLKRDNATFFLEREGNVLKKIILSFTGVDIKHAPAFAEPGQEGEHYTLTASDGGYATLARREILNWQAILSGVQIVDLDLDNVEMRFHAENPSEEDRIHVKSIKSGYDKSAGLTHDFEQFGRAFCADAIADNQIEATSHYRDGRLAFEAGRYVDAYNNMFLFLETRYCDGKTKTKDVVELLLGDKELCSIIETNAVAFGQENQIRPNEQLHLFNSCETTDQKVKALVLLRGSLRHHSLKNPHRWDPNRQNKHRGEACFLMAVVHEIVIKEGLAEIYAPAALEEFRKQSVNGGYEMKIKLSTQRLNREPALVLDMSYPTTVASSLLCVNTFRQAMESCQKNGQLSDTVSFQASVARRNLELFSLDFGVWAYSAKRLMETNEPFEYIQCSFERIRDGFATSDQFSIPCKGSRLSIIDVWSLLKVSFDHIEKRDPTTQIMSLKLLIDGDRRSIVSYRVGAILKS